jgi:cytoskeleton protein RodZ
MGADRPDDFGSTLRQARERKGVTLRQIATRTKISVAVLEALERNDISRLPGGIFSRGFVRSYAAEVGLDPEAAVHEFVAQFPHDSVTAGHPTSNPIEDNEEIEAERRMANTVLWMLLVSVPVAGAVLYLGMLSRRPAVAPEHPPAISAPAPAAPEPDAHRPAETPQPAASEPVATPAPASTMGAVPLPAPAAASDKLVVGLTARSPVWVQATIDGRKAMDRLLQRGERQTLEVSKELVLTAGDASALALTINGADARPLGKSGDVVRARLTPANFKEFLQAR